MVILRWFCGNASLGCTRLNMVLLFVFCGSVSPTVFSAWIVQCPDTLDSAFALKPTVYVSSSVMSPIIPRFEGLFSFLLSAPLMQSLLRYGTFCYRL